MISPFAWFLIIYTSAGLYLLMDALVFAWEHHEGETWIKVIGTIISVLVWPLMFFV